MSFPSNNDAALHRVEAAAMPEEGCSGCSALLIAALLLLLLTTIKVGWAKEAVRLGELWAGSGNVLQMCKYV